MIRKFVLAASVLTLFATPALAQVSKLQAQAENGPTLQRLGNSLGQLIQQMQAYGAQQQKTNPQNAAMVQGLLVQADYMRGMASVLYTQNQANAKAEAMDKQKKLIAKDAAEKMTPLAAQQKKISDQAMKSQQAKLDAAVKQIEAGEMKKPTKDQSQLIGFQLSLMRAHGTLDRIMLDEMDD